MKYVFVNKWKPSKDLLTMHESHSQAKKGEVHKKTYLMAKNEWVHSEEKEWYDGKEGDVLYPSELQNFRSRRWVSDAEIGN